jgi:SAM-dependent methyltransferase
MLAPEIAAGNPTDADYDYDDLRAVEGHHFWFTNRAQLVAWAIEQYFPDAGSVLDLGCGTGGPLVTLQRLLPHVRFVAADALLSGLAFARARLPAVSFLQVDLRHLPYDREFDLIGSFDVLEHLDDDEQALQEMYRATAPGGGLVVTVPQHRFLWSALDQYSRHRRRYTRRDLVEKIERVGYSVQRATSFMTLTLPVQILSRLRLQDITALNPGAEMTVNPVVNSVLGAVCRVERAAIMSGLSLPVGGSLLVIAKRT